MRGRHLRNTSAFTLLELLVVIAIIALLLAILLPALGGAKRAANSTKCLSQLRSIGQSVSLYHNDFDGVYPLSSHGTGSLEHPAGWLHCLIAYGVEEEWRFCPDDEFADDKASSFATNDHFEPLVAGIDYDPFSGKTLPGGRRRAFRNVIQIPFPTSTVYVAEPRAEGTVDHLHSVGWETPDQVFANIEFERHDETTNFLYADGHAGKVARSLIKNEFSAETSMFNPETAH